MRLAWKHLSHGWFDFFFQNPFLETQNWQDDEWQTRKMDDVFGWKEFIPFHVCTERSNCTSDIEVVNLVVSSINS